MSQEVWEKSGGVCYICGERMGRNGEFGDLLNFTVDHWIPKSKARGKRATKEGNNLVGAHYLCNQTKRNGVVTPEIIKSCAWQVRKIMKAYAA